MHTYDDNCELTWENFLSNFDHYYACHLFGWFVMAFMLRNRLLIHTWSILDEFIELSWQHILPHLRECWWDHVIVDVLLSNTVGIETALFVMKKTGMKTYDWLGMEGAKSWREWKIFTCHRTFGFVVTFYLFVIGRFLTMFFFLNSMLIPPYHFVSVVRLLCWAIFAFLPIREIYEDIRTWNTSGRKDNRVEGNYRWLGIAVILLEIATSYKFRKGTKNMNEDAETPWYIILPWSIILTTMLSFYLYLRFKKDRTKKFIVVPEKSKEAEKKKKK